jgi:1,4-dihydroxy-2-naphthoate octaprenyltransferase
MRKASIICSALTIIVYLWIVGGVVTRLMPAFSLIVLATFPLAIKAIQGAMKYQDISRLVPGMANNVLFILSTQFLLGVGYILATVL